jgi:hypothetical protein
MLAMTGSQAAPGGYLAAVALVALVALVAGIGISRLGAYVKPQERPMLRPA